MSETDQESEKELQLWKFQSFIKGMPAETKKQLYIHQRTRIF